MLNLLPLTFGNRRPDAHGNVHSRHDDRATVIRHPGSYAGRHRRPGFADRLLGLAPGSYDKSWVVLAVLGSRD